MQREVRALACVAAALVAMLIFAAACDRGDEGYKDQRDQYEDQIECGQACAQLEECDLLAPDFPSREACMADCQSDDPSFDRDCVFMAQDCEAMANCFFEDD